MSGPQLTILIATMDRRDLLELTLYYLYETSTHEERNIWIWDNGSVDDTAAFLGTMQGWPGVRCFRSPADVGIMGAKKRMLRAVTTPYVFTLDDDMWMVHKGWVGAVVRVLEAEASIHQLSFGQFGDKNNNFGIVHTELERPFFRVPPPSAGVCGCDRHVGANPQSPAGTRVIDVAGEAVIVPESGVDLPFANTGGCAGWRTKDIIPLLSRAERHPVIDLREAWGVPLAARGTTREAHLMGYGIFHPSPGPIWHLGRGERYWQERCRMAGPIYNRSAEEQARWLEVARVESGWGRHLDDPDEVLR